LLWFYQISSKLVQSFGLQTPDVQCAVARQRPLPWQPHHGDMSGTSWDATTQVSSQSVHCLASYFMSNIFQYGGRPPFCILKTLIFDHVTVIVVLICCRVPNFIKIGSRVRLPDAHNCRIYNAPLLGNGRCHGNHIMADMSGS